MKHQREKYIAGYCVALIMIATIWFRLEGTVRTQETPLSPPESAEAAKLENSSSAAKESNGERSEGETASDGEQDAMESVPSYQQMYPDMYVEQVSTQTSASVQDEEIRKFFMTFDDGPSENTKEVVEALNQVGAKAAFFLIGEEITADREELLCQMVADGHILGVHTYTHNHKDIYSSVGNFLTDFHETYERIYEVTGVKPVYFRFPWGSINCYNKEIRKELIAEMERRGFQYFDWNVSAEDSIGKPTEYSVLHNVIDNFPKFRKAVVLMHDSGSNKISAKILPEILRTVAEQGYVFGRIDELEKPYQWTNSY